MTLMYDLDFQSLASYDHDPHTCKTQSQRSSVGLKSWWKRTGRTDTTDRIYTFLTNAVCYHSTILGKGYESTPVCQFVSLFVC